MGGGQQMTGGSYFMPAMPVQPNQFMPRPGQMIRATPRWGNQPVSWISWVLFRVSDQELKVYFRCQWQISDPECQWVNHLKVNIIFVDENGSFFILVRGGQQQFKLTNTVRNVPSIDNGMVGMVQPAPQAPIPTVDGQEPLTSSMLAAANPQEQKQMLGERLFPLIQVRIRDYWTRK